MPPKRHGPGARARARAGNSGIAGQQFHRSNSTPGRDKLGDLFAHLRLRRWRVAHRGKRVGFADVTLVIGLAIDGVVVFSGDNGPWAALPGRPVLDARGYHKRDPDGRPAFEPVCRWSTREVADAFSAAAIGAIRSQYGAEAFIPTACPPPRQTSLGATVRQLPLGLGPPS